MAIPKPRERGLSGLLPGLAHAAKAVEEFLQFFLIPCRSLKALKTSMIVENLGWLRSIGHYVKLLDAIDETV